MTNKINNIRVIRSMQGLENIRLFWESVNKHPNIDFEHFKLVCQIRKEVVCPYVAIVEVDGISEFLMAGRIENTFFMPSVGYLTPVRIPAKVLSVLYQGLIGREYDEMGDALVNHLWSFLRSGEIDAVVFNHLHENSPILKTLLINGPTFWCEKRFIWSTHWAAGLPEEPGLLLKKLRSKHRTWIRKREKELEAAFPGEVQWRWLTEFHDISGLCRSLESVAVRTYQRGLGAGFFDDEEHRRRLSLFANRGQLRVQMLDIQGKPHAFWIGEVYNGIYYSSMTGYVPNLRQYEIGTLVFIHMIDELVREGIRKLDFGLGEAFYKSRFGDHCWQETTVRLFAPTPKGFVLRSSLGFFGLVDVTARYLLKKLKILDRLKTGWRRRLTPEGETE